MNIPLSLSPHILLLLILLVLLVLATVTATAPSHPLDLPLPLPAMPSAPTYATDPQILANALTEPELGSSNRILATVPPLKKPTPFKTTTNGWEAIPILPGPHPPTRRSHSGTLYPPSTPSAAPSLITSFGFHSTSTIDILPLKDVWSFNLHTSQWALVWQGEGMERGSHVTAVYGDTLFSFGGELYVDKGRAAVMT